MGQVVDDSAIAAFALISVLYLGLMWLTVFVARRELKLICAGLLTAVAALGYGCLVLPGGPVLAPHLMKLAFLLVLGGLALLLLERCPPPPPPPPPSPEDRP